MTAGPVFIVGASRSGTTLLVRILSRGGDLVVAPETHYFEDLRPRMGGVVGRRLEPPDRQACEDYFLALTHRPYGQRGDPARGNMDRMALRQRATAIGAGSDAYFQAFCELVAAERGAGRWGEKTPRHVYAIDEILGAFPDAQVIGLVRDPRAVVASYRDWENRYRPGDAETQAALARDHARSRLSYNVVIQSMLWRSSVQAIEVSVQRWGTDRVRTLRFEDLINQPETTTTSLCDWLDMRFDPGMLDITVANSSYTAVGTQGMQSETVGRWRAHMTDDETAVVQAVTTRVAPRWGYQPVPVSRRVAPLVRAGAGLPMALSRAILANRGRIGSLPTYLLRRARLTLGRP